MNKQLTLLCSLAASLLFSFAAQAAETAEIKVKGTIRPPACIPTFAGGNTVDYGVIPVANLKANTFTQLETRYIPLTVTCDAKMQIALTATDNRASSRVYGVGKLPDIHVFGLGSVDGKNVGGYTLYLGKNMNVDGKVLPNNLFKENSIGASWSGGYGGGSARFDNNASYLFSLGDSLALATGKVWTFDIQLTTWLNKPENLNLTGSIPLDGSATIEVKYL